MSQFNSSYYARFYGRDGAHDVEKISDLATAVHHMSAWWGAQVTSVLDVGAGMGMWRDWYLNNHPDVTVRSIDISEHACATWGHECHNIVNWRPRGKYDLVICHSVLQYLSNAEFVHAVENIAAATRYVLYLELPTKWDFENIVDARGTDLQVYQRSAQWYRRHLLQHFRPVGAGLWTPLRGLPMYELEASR